MKLQTRPTTVPGRSRILINIIFLPAHRIIVVSDTLRKRSSFNTASHPVFAMSYDPPTWVKPILGKEFSDSCSIAPTSLMAHVTQSSAWNRHNHIRGQSPKGTVTAQDSHIRRQSHKGTVTLQDSHITGQSY